jgi:hypothetical protein
MDQPGASSFRVFRALGLASKAWLRNFVPFTLLALVVYSPVLFWAFKLPSADAIESTSQLNSYVTFFERGVFLLMGLSALLSPLITYRVIQDMNGVRVPLMQSIKFGLRGIVPALLFAAVIALLSLLPMGGGLIGAVVTCYWFVAAPVAVVENQGVSWSFSRSAHLTAGRRGGIFGLVFLINLVLIALVAVIVAPLFHARDMELVAIVGKLRSSSILIVAVLGVYQLFLGIVQAVSYSLLRADKDGVNNEDLAQVFD